MTRIITWKPPYAAREPEIAEVLRQLLGDVYIRTEAGQERWIPGHWIIEDEEA